MLQHAAEQVMHELWFGTMGEIHWQNKVMTTYGVAMYTLYNFTHGGPEPLFRKLANQPFLVFLSMVLSIVETQGMRRIFENIVNHR